MVVRCKPCYHPPRRVLGLDRSVFVAQLGDIQAVKRDAAGETNSYGQSGATPHGHDCLEAL